MLPNISAICAAVPKNDQDIGSALVDVSDGETFEKEVDDENEIVDGVELDGVELDGVKLDGVRLDGVKLDGVKLDGVKLDGITEEGANDAVTKIEMDVGSGRV